MPGSAPQAGSPHAQEIQIVCCNPGMVYGFASIVLKNNNIWLFPRVQQSVVAAGSLQPHKHLCSRGPCIAQ